MCNMVLTPHFSVWLMSESHRCQNQSSGPSQQCYSVLSESMMGCFYDALHMNGNISISLDDLFKPLLEFHSL